MPGEPDPLYRASRKVLLDALEALGTHRDAIILGAHAIYVIAGEGGLTVPPYTTDADLAIDPGRLRPEPHLEEVMTAAGFSTRDNPLGRWSIETDIDGVPIKVFVDFLVPHALSGGGTRGARLGPHGNRVARKARGLEAALVDNDIVIVSLEGDPRSYSITAAGLAALLVSKVHKLAERGDEEDLETNKDALDVLRILRAAPAAELARRYRILLGSGIAGEVAREAVEHLRNLFLTPQSTGSRRAGIAAGQFEDPGVIAASAATLANDLLKAIREQHADE